MPYDNFTREQICGIFSPAHFIALAVIIALLTISLLLSRKLDERQARRVMFITAIVITVMEVIKVTLRLIVEPRNLEILPLAYCSLFIYSIWFSFSKKEFIRKIGMSYLVFGGIFAGCAYLIYPTTSLAIRPLWHPASIHSLLYHATMVYTGILIIMKKLYEPEFGDWLNYLILTGGASLLAAILNSILGTNLMFLDNPFGLAILDGLNRKAHIAYSLLAAFAQTCLLFWAMFGVYKLTRHIVSKRSRRKN